MYLATPTSHEICIFIPSHRITLDKAPKKLVKVTVGIPIRKVSTLPYNMAKVSSLGASAPDRNAINLTRLLARLQKTLLDQDITTEQRLRSSGYERRKVGTVRQANFTIANGTNFAFLES
jgi:hypothetical protein